MVHKRLAFCWQGISDPDVFRKWRDGLWQAVEVLRETYQVEYREPNATDLNDFDVILYWEAPCTITGRDADKYKNVLSAKPKKILLFAGGPLKKEWVEGFDIVVVESEINAKECREQGIRYDEAFGVNCDIWRPSRFWGTREFIGAHHGACAGWKRQHLAAEALGKDLILVGPYQSTDPYTFDRSKELGATVISERVEPRECKEYVERASVLVQTSDFWGGGQRATLEAMALGMPVVVMEDSPKNREFVEALGLGRVVPPQPSLIKEACDELVAEWNDNKAVTSRTYVMTYWSGQKYGRDLKRIIESL